MTDEREYVLGTDDEELARLGLQHRAWRVAALEGFANGGFLPGMKLLDLGAGPGWVTVDLAELVGPKGRITAVEISPRFAKHLRATAAARGLGNVDVIEGDAEALELPAASLDGAWTRWVLAFLKRPERAVAAVARALKPGARFVIHEYVAYDSMRVAPRSAAFDTVVKAVITSWRASGGEPDRALELPDMLESAGLELTSVRMLPTVARPTDLRWLWPDSFYKSYLPTLVKGGWVTQETERTFWVDWKDRATRPGAYFVGPTVLETVATAPPKH
jgi:ubiquinone/menaquinone biosynthesis C-methylase UbiE